MKKLLITTALKETWLIQSNYERIFLGEWCKLYSEKSHWEALNFDDIQYHWDDRIKLKSDHDYLKNVYEKVLKLLTQKLNHIHSLNENENYWRIVLGPWLITYIPIIFDRWEMINKAFENHDHYVCVFSKFEEPDSMIANDFSNFLELMQNDSWNYNIYQRILFEKYTDKIEFIEIDQIKLETNKIRTNQSISFKKQLQQLFEGVISFININKRVFFYNSYFTPSKLISLNFALNQLPQTYHNVFNFNFTKKADFNIRKINEFNVQQMNEFETFLLTNIFKDIPTAYLEEFNQISNKIEKLNFPHKIILTANAYWADDVFKIWAAKKKKEGCKLFISQHGGSFPPLFDTFSHEEDISDKHITWFKPYHHKHVQLPPNKIDKRISTIGKNCCIIGFESPRYSYRVTAGAISHQSIFNFEQISILCDLLNKNVKNYLAIRPYPNMGWYSKQRYIDKFTETVIDKSPNYQTFINNAKILICTYPQTTFSEAMASGKPTILLFEPKYNEIISDAENLMQSLFKVKIAFTDPNLAAKHINYIWNDIDAWWNNNEVIKVRNMFFDLALRINHDWKKEWINFLTHEENEVNKN